MKSLTELWMTVLTEVGTMCHASTKMDSKRAHLRIEHEGLSFLTITLPGFCRDFEKSLEDSQVGQQHFRGFKRKGGLPLFLGGFLDRVFDRGTGRLLDDPCSDSIWAIRQLTLMFAKIQLPCSDARTRRAIKKYVECEQEVRTNDAGMTPELLEEFRRTSIVLFGDVLAEVDLKVYDGTLVPKHGPGATADRLRGNAKYDQVEWTTRLEEVFPYGDYALPNWRYSYRLDSVDFLEPGDERPVRVITVPKTLKTPRIIAVEPTCMQYAQQAVAEALVNALESDALVNSMIGFTKQEPNQLLACEGSAKGRLATLDLSEASDRVSNQHVRALVSNFPHLHEALDASRSRKADVPGHGVIRLAKYASMGSALCFPVEAMVFLTVVFMGIQRAHNRQFSRRDIKSYAGRVRVYGDDIIVPVDCVESVIECLESFGLKVNLDKSFWNGKFRESCGRDYYDGTDVSVVRVRHMLPSKRTDSEGVIATVSLRNRLYLAGLWRTARWVDSRMVPLMRHYPYVAPTSPALGRISFLGYETQKLHAHLHKPMVKAYVAHSRPPRSLVSGEGALLKWFLKRGDEPFADRDHLTRQGRPRAVDTKLRWASSI